MRLKNFFLFIILILLVACQNSNEPNHGNSNKAEVFFENIYVGDKLESCLAKGAVQYNTDYKTESSVQEQKNMLELANNDIASSYFPFAGVWFDNDNIVNRIELKFHQIEQTESNKAKSSSEFFISPQEIESDKTAKEVFNFMTQYFCQRYQGLKTETVTEQWKLENWGAEFKKEGIKNIWETNKVRIILQFYNNLRIDKEPVIRPNEYGYYYGEQAAALIARDFVRSAAEKHIGNWVEVNILAK